MTRKQKGVPHSGGQPAPGTPSSPTPDAPPPTQEKEAVAPRRAGKPFPIVGIGASAGGLEALELFLQHVPAGSGMAYVIVQHLDPTHKAMLSELLQRVTSMKVAQVVDRTRVRPNCVYVIPPNADMSILHGVLHLLEPRAPRGLRLPIDFFFRALAEDLQGRSVGVVLSGMGSDGTLGLRAIREKAGAAFVQEPSSAKFDGMPRSAVDAGVADVVAPVEALPGKIIDYLRHVTGLVHPRPTLGANDQSGLEKVAILLRVQTGHDFSLYKKSTLYRRIERRMGLHQIGKIPLYVRYLQENPAELELLFKELLIGVTSFFRDPPAWEKLKAEVLPALLAERSPDRPLRAWIPACSTGEEAYSLAIAFKEAIEQLKPAANFTLQIFATDLDSDAIEQARSGVFPPNIAADLSPERLDRYFVQTECGYTVGKPIRDMVIFAPHNVIMDPPFTRIDILSCRNLLIYMTPELQNKILPLFHYTLNPGGILFLGSAETTSGFGDLFESLDAKSRLYRRRDGVLRSEAVEFPSAFLSARPGGAGGPRDLPARPQSPNAGGSPALADLRPRRRAGQRPGGHPLHQRADGQLSRTRGGQGQLEYFCHGPRRAPLRTDHGLPQGPAAAGTGHFQEYQGGGPRGGARRGPHRPGHRGAGGPAGIGDGGPGRSGTARGCAAAGHPRAPGRPPAAGADGTGAGRGPPRGPVHPGGDAGLAGGAEIQQRGNAVDERRAAIDQRGADDLEGRDAVDERGTANAQPRAAGQARRPVPPQQRYEEPAGKHRNYDALSGRRAARAAVYGGGENALQADSRRCGAPDHGYHLRVALSGAGGSRTGGVEDAGLSRAAGAHAGRAVVPGAHHALPHPGEQD